MKLSIGIVGLPNVGKSTLFKTLTEQKANIANYSFTTIDPNVGMVNVPDERLEQLSKISNSKKIVPAVVEFYDIAGLVKDAYKGEGLGNQFLSHIREVNAIVQVIRCFKSEEIIHVEQNVNPVRDINIVNTELIMKDLDTVEKRLDKLEADARNGDKNKIKELETVKKAREILNNGKLLNMTGEKFINEPVIREMTLLTIKPQIYLLNGEPGDVSERLKNEIKLLNADYIVINLAKAGALLDELIKKSYEILGLISFLTIGEDETRAWTIKKETKAPQAAGVIHTDFEKKFIKAETINWSRLLEAGSWQTAKAKGWIRLEGKEYIIQDGDVIIIKHG